jgi:flagellar motor switch protein FliM
LDSGVQSDRVEQDDRWSLALRHELEDAELDVRAVLGTATLSLSDLRALKPGDVIATDFTGAVTLMAEGLPVLRGNYGHSRGQYAVKVTERIQRSLVSGLDEPTDGPIAVKAARTSPYHATESK